MAGTYQRSRGHSAAGASVGAAGSVSTLLEQRAKGGSANIAASSYGHRRATRNMGIDAHICFRAEGELPEAFMGELEEDLPDLFEVAPRGESDPPGATHAVHSPYRYYGEGYERGPWPRICAALMILHRHPNITAVWYGGDDKISRCEPDDIVKLCLHFMGVDT